MNWMRISRRGSDPDQTFGRLEAGRGLEGVLGVAYRRGGEIVRNPPRPLIEDLEVANKLVVRGFKNTRVLEGGLSEWEKKGYPVEP